MSLLAYLPILAMAQGLNAMTYKGCYSSSRGLSDQGSHIYQTSGYCQPICVDQGSAVLGLSGGSDCWCGDQLPPEDSLVDDSNCDTGCNGYRQEDCGGDGYYSVYLTGEKDDDDVSNVGSGGNSGNNNDSNNSSDDDDDDDDSASSSSSSNSDSDSSTTTSSAPRETTRASTAQPSVITSVAPGTTVVVTQTPAPDNADADRSRQSLSPEEEEENNSDDSGSDTNVAGIAAGVVVGVLVLIAIAVGAFFFIRRRRKQRAEQEYNRSNQVSDFMAGGGAAPGMRETSRPPNTGYSQMSDQRLDPEVGRRNSVGSIADNEDYSRRILRVANPDRG
ncbi:hypothetical protein MBLNU230_g7179t1 [Neophaeotheca triangularis]